MMSSTHVADLKGNIFGNTFSVIALIPSDLGMGVRSPLGAQKLREL